MPLKPPANYLVILSLFTVLGWVALGVLGIFVGIYMGLLIAGLQHYSDLISRHLKTKYFLGCATIAVGLFIFITQFNVIVTLPLATSHLLTAGLPVILICFGIRLCLEAAEIM